MSVLAQYNGGAASADSADANITAGNLTKHANLTTFNVNTTLGYATDPSYQAFPEGGATSQANAVSLSSYIEFTITPTGGYEMDLTSLTFKVARGGASTPRGWGLRSSIDSYAANIQTADCATQRPTYSDITVDLSGAGFQNLTAAITFRMYFYAPADTSSVDFDSLTLNGTMTAPAGSTQPPRSMHQFRMRRT